MPTPAKGVVYLSIGWTEMFSVLRWSSGRRSSWYIRNRIRSRLGNWLLRSLRINAVDFDGLEIVKIDPHSFDTPMRHAVDRIEELNLEAALSHFAQSWPDCSRSRQIFRIGLLRAVSRQVLDAFYAKTWATAKGLDDVVFVRSSNWDDLVFDTANSGTRVVGWVSLGIRALTKSLRKVLPRAKSSLLTRTWARENRKTTDVRNPEGGPLASQAWATPENARVMFILHQGELGYGSLFSYVDNLLGYQEEDPDLLRPHNVVLTSPTGLAPNSDESVAPIPSGGLSLLQAPGLLFRVLRAKAQNLRRVRADVLFFLAHFDAISQNQARKLRRCFPRAQLAIFAFDVQVPLTLTLALEANNVETVACSERPVSIVNEMQPFAVGTLLTADPAMSRRALMSRSLAIKSATSIGMWRTDLLTLYGKEHPHPLWWSGSSISKDRVVVLLHPIDIGDEWGGNPLLTSVSVARHFLEDVHQLARQHPMATFVVRGKSDGWMDHPGLRDTVNRLNDAVNIKISTEYARVNETYRLCAHSTLVIAKYTSMVDELLAFGTSCLIHDYSHNVSGVCRRLCPHLEGDFWLENEDEFRSATAQYFREERIKAPDGCSPTEEDLSPLANGHVRSRAKWSFVSLINGTSGD